MSKGLPRTARPVNAVEAAGDLVEENLRLFLAAGEHALEIDLVAVVFGEFLRAANGELDEFAGDGIGLRVQPVKSALAVAPRFHERAIGEQAEMRGDARLAEAGDFLEFVDRQLVFFQQRDDAQPGWIGQRPQRFQGGGHVFFWRGVFLRKHLTRLESVISSYLDTSICCWRETLKNIP
jgi:hypothetical protein